MNNRLLIVVDMQNDFIDGPLGTEEARSIVSKVKDKITQAYRTWFTVDTHDNRYLETQEGIFLPVSHCIVGTEGRAIHHDLVRDMQIVETFSKSTFGSTHIGECIRKMFDERVIDTVELVGVCTDICVISNALLIKAYCPEIPIYVDASCCAGSTPDRHQAALNVMRSCQINVI